jgi:hypothetical protein
MLSCMVKIQYWQLLAVMLLQLDVAEVAVESWLNASLPSNAVSEGAAAVGAGAGCYVQLHAGMHAAAAVQSHVWG